MALAVAVPLALGAAIAYGGSTAVQHSAAHTGTGRADARRLVRLLRDPRWLLSIGGDGLGLTLQVLALATGPVALIQPLLVLAVPVSLPAAWLLGGPKPGRGAALACLAILGGLAGFFALLGDPGSGRVPGPSAVLGSSLGVLTLGGLACLAVGRGGARMRAGVYGAAGGALFGVSAVLITAVSSVWTGHGLAGFGTPNGLIPLIAALVVGGVGMALTQVSFQVGALAASFPANESATPIVAVLLGGLVLRERVPCSAPVLACYALCVVVMCAGAIRIAAEAPC